MEAQKFIICFGCNDFVFEGSILELANIVRTLEKLTPVLASYKTGTYQEAISKKLRIYSAKEEVEADANNTIYVIDK